MFKIAPPLRMPYTDKQALLKVMCRFDLSIHRVVTLLDINESTFISWMCNEPPAGTHDVLECAYLEHFNRHR